MREIMSQKDSYILPFNGGSSSIKSAVYGSIQELTLKLGGKIDRIGPNNSRLNYTDTIGRKHDKTLQVTTLSEGARYLVDWLEKQHFFKHVNAGGHWVVHGTKHKSDVLVTDHLLEELRTIRDYDPDHLPGEIELTGLLHNRYFHLPQIAYFDTAFHADMPRAARLLPIPRRFDEAGIQRYGFPGLSYTYLMKSLADLVGVPAVGGRVILARLGNGASMAAVKEGKSIDTTMGFTSAGSLVMGTRPDDLDPGLAWYLMTNQQLSPTQFNVLINHESVSPKQALTCRTC